MTGSLTTYQSKRNFSITPEPSGRVKAGGRDHLQYVVQKHWARQLHYDFRLELDGVMKSWAVPKGPSLDPRQKRMAVQVEDHPLAYNQFEGEIPAGQYGAGQVILWDAGYWVPLGDPHKDYRDGKLKFELHGEKLKGRWTLVRMHGHEKDRQPAWLLIKEADGWERSADDFDVLLAMPDSVSTVSALAADDSEPPARPRVPLKRSNKTASTFADMLTPQLAELHSAPPSNLADWAWELKFDGYRILARKQGSDVRLFTRSGKDWTHKMPSIATELAGLSEQAFWLDGEVVALNADGVPDFQRLQNAFDVSSDLPLSYFVFDLLFDGSTDLRPWAWADRRERLSALLHNATSDILRLSESFDVPPSDMLSCACSMGFEGIMGKRKAAPYVGRRSADWIKLKCQKRQEFVIGGYTDPAGSRIALGALLLGYYNDQGDLLHAGNVGTGFSDLTLKRLKEKLAALDSTHSPFQHASQIDARGVHWVRPELIAEISFAGWTNDGRIRHSVFHGLRDDKVARSIRRETAQGWEQGANSTNSAISSAMKGTVMPAKESTVSGVHISNPERVVDARSGVTKMDLAQYYAEVAPLMMEHLSQRPVALMRAPEGISGELFFQKHWQSVEIEGVRQLDPELDPGHAPLVMVSDPIGVVHAAQMNVVEFHTWNAKRDRIDRPDRLILDLDPGEGVAWSQVLEGAQLVKTLLQELGLNVFLKTSGGKGLHVVTPIQRRHDWSDVKGFSKAVVQHLAETIPARFVLKSGPQNRKGKIFVDYLRNGRGATTVCAWSARARADMGVSVPIEWKELESIESGAQWTIRNIKDRLAIGNAAWAHYAGSAVSLSPAMKAIGYAS